VDYDPLVQPLKLFSEEYMSRYIVIDVETPNRENTRISAIGITVIENGAITDHFFSYVDPEQQFDPFNVELTGIDEYTVSEAPTFPKLWEQIRPLMESGTIVAHNAQFDLGVLKACLRDYGIYWKPRAQAICTVLIGRKILPDISHKLNNMCAYYGICLNHHQADSDSQACAEIFLRYIQDGTPVDQYIKDYEL
jgi:DNA polymerase-3 subunit epsilon